MATRRSRQNCGSRARSFASSIGRRDAAHAQPASRQQPPRRARPRGTDRADREDDNSGASRHGERHRGGLEERPRAGVSSPATPLPSARRSLTPRGALICSRCPKRLKFQEVSSSRRDASDVAGRHREWRAIRNSGARTRCQVRTESESASRRTSPCHLPREMRSQPSGSAPMSGSWVALPGWLLARATRTRSGPSDVGFLSTGRRSVAARALQHTRCGWFLGDGWSR